MSLGDVLDLAILTFEELRGLARRHSIDGLDSMARAEVVGKLREAGVGVGHPSAAGGVERLGEMMQIVVSNRDELAVLRDDQRREITAAEGRSIPLLEVEAIVKRELASFSDRVGNLERETAQACPAADYCPPGDLFEDLKSTKRPTCHIPRWRIRAWRHCQEWTQAQGVVFTGLI